MVTLAIAVLSAMLVKTDSDAALRCPAATIETLRARAPEDGSPVRIVFFSTWCSTCAQHLHAVEGTPTWVVGAFDTPERVVQGLAHTGLDVPCFMATEALLDGLKIRRVPSVWRLTRGAGLEKP